MLTIPTSAARRLMIAHLGLERFAGRGAAATRKTLARLRCIQLDPLDVIGTNADLVVIARVEDAMRGNVWRHLYPRHAFEHFAKERCILPADAFPYYRERGHAAQTPWWKHADREKRVPKNTTNAVLAEVKARGPLTARDLTDHGAVEAIDWSGWSGTSKATSMALELLWTTCDVVVSGRTPNGAKIYDVPERSLGSIARAKPAAGFERWALRERVQAAGLLTRASGSSWSMLSEVRLSTLIDDMINEEKLLEVTIEGTSRRYLALPSFLKKRPARYDNRVRILAPLDPLLWDRALVRHIFDFDYVWEVYKPEKQRRWGWYVCPLLHRDQLIGRVEARTEKNSLVVKKLWLRSGIDPTAREAVNDALGRHALACGCNRVRMPRRILRE